MGEEGDGWNAHNLSWKGCMATLEDGGSGVFYPALWVLWQARRQGLRCSAPIESAEAEPPLEARQPVNLQDATAGGPLAQQHR